MAGAITITALADNVNDTQFQWDAERATIDMAAKPTPLLDNLRSMSKKPHDGGELIIEPHEFGTHSVPSRFDGAGFNLIDYSFQTLGNPARWEWADFCQPIGYSGHEKRLNSGSAMIIDKVKSRQLNVQRHHDRLIQRSFLIQDAPALSDILPINGVDYADGALEAAAVGAQTNTYLNLSKSVFAAFAGWQNQYATANGSFSTEGVTKLRAMMNAAKRLGSAQNTKAPPKFKLYVSDDFYDNYDRETLLVKRWVNSSGPADLVGGDQEKFGTADLHQINDDMPTTGPWSALLLDHAMVDYHVNQGLDAKMGQWHPMAAAHQDAMVALLHTMIQLSFGYLGTSGILTNADTY
jgi:hypothetical protein